MNSSGYSLDNIHQGDTFIEGSLFVDGQIIAEGSTGQSEYLDSGTYDPIFSNFLNINTVAQKTANGQKTIFTKNGNIITLDTNLDITYPSLSSGTTTIFRFNITVPSSLDILDAKLINPQAPCITGSTDFGILLTNAFVFAEGVITIQLQARTINIPLSIASLSLKIVYKLEGDDIPATAIVTSGGGTSGDVQNPMQENLDGGGFNITNLQNLTAQGTVTANSISAPNVITNPLNSDLSLNGNLLQNSPGSIANINMASSSMTINGVTAFNDNIFVQKITGSDPNNGLIIDNTSGINENIYIRGEALIMENTSDLFLNGSRIYDNPGDTANIFVGPTDMSFSGVVGCNDKLIAASGIDSLNDIDIKSGVLISSEVKSSGGNLTLTGQSSGLPSNIVISGNTTQISCVNGVDMLNHNISNCALIYSQNLNDTKLIRNESDFINTNLSGSYIIYGDIDMTLSYTLVGDTTITGIGRDISSLNFNIPDPGSNYCLNNTNYNLEITNINISNVSANFSLLKCVNTNKDKIITFSNCSFRDCENQEVINIQGFDLVDLNQVLFQYNNSAVKHFYHDSGSKLQISSCEFLRQGQRANPIISWGTSPMIELAQTISNWGAINISGNLIHPQQTQDGIKLQAITPLEAVISNNTFISVGLTTGILINYTAGNIDNYPSLIVSDNSGTRNEKSLLEGTTNNNTTYTSTVLNTWVTIDFGVNFTSPIISRFSSTANPFEFKYDAKQPISCLVNSAWTCSHNTGSNDDIKIGISQNGTVVSEFTTSINASVAKSFSFNTVLLLEQNDTLVFVCQNITSGTDSQGLLCEALQATLIEV